MRVPFKLEASERIVPASGESLGQDLRDAGDALLSRMTTPSDAWTWRVVVLWNLAADAFESGAAASIGHNRAERYREAARKLRQNAHNLMEGRY